MDMQPHSTLLCALFVAGCFVDDGDYVAGDSGSETDISEDTMSDTESSDHESSDVSSDETWTDDSSSDFTTDTWSGSDEDTTGDVTSSDTSTDSDSSSDDCAPVDVEVDGAFEAGESRTIYLDFDDFPGSPGETVELCITFTSTNPASARTITIGETEVAFGPCGGGGPGPGFTSCAPFVKPEGLTEVIIDNTTFGPGCQTGTMDDLVLSFGCDPGG